MAFGLWLERSRPSVAGEKSGRSAARALVEEGRAFSSLRSSRHRGGGEAHKSGAQAALRLWRHKGKKE